jgi:putative phage-type endonuclease
MSAEGKKIDDIFDDFDIELHNEIDKGNAKEVFKYDNLDETNQGSREWFALRLGLFTGSKLPNLMKSGRAKDEKWGETAKTVIVTAAIERDLSDEGKELYIDELFRTEFKQTAWGKKYESEARDLYAKLMEKEIEKPTFQIHEDYPFLGGSFDGIVVGENKIIEIKCPYNVFNHSKNIELSYVAGSINEKHDYYAQMQGNIEIAGADSCDFISYDPRRKTDSNRIVIINVPRDQTYIDRLIERVMIAEKAVSYILAGVDVSGAILLAENDYYGK